MKDCYDVWKVSQCCFEMILKAYLLLRRVSELHLPGLLDDDLRHQGRHGHGPAVVRHLLARVVVA